MDENKLVQQAAKGSQAKHLLDNEAFKNALQILEITYIERWKQAKDPAIRDEAWTAVNVIRDIKIYLRAVIDNGGKATKELERLRQPKKKFSIF